MHSTSPRRTRAPGSRVSVRTVPSIVSDTVARLCGGSTSVPLNDGGFTTAADSGSESDRRSVSGAVAAAGGLFAVCSAAAAAGSAVRSAVPAQAQQRAAHERKSVFFILCFIIIGTIRIRERRCYSYGAPRRSPCGSPAHCSGFERPRRCRRRPRPTACRRHAAASRKPPSPVSRSNGYFARRAQVPFPVR